MKFYHFDQNNSGGKFVINDKLDCNVMIQATNAGEANEIAESLGIYFDGWGDCPCCGNRWNKVSEADGYDVPYPYGYDKDNTEVKVHYYPKVIDI